jgi:hypothetical protein
VVAEVVALLGRGVELGDGGLLAVQGQHQHLLGGLADPDGAQPLQVGVAVEEQDPLDQVVGVAHLVDGEVVEDLPELGQTPGVEHAGVQEVRIGDGELEGQRVVEQFDHSGANGLHRPLPFLVRHRARLGPGNADTRGRGGN